MGDASGLIEAVPVNQMRERERDGGLLFVYNYVNEYVKTKTEKKEIKKEERDQTANTGIQLQTCKKEKGKENTSFRHVNSLFSAII